MKNEISFDPSNIDEVIVDVNVPETLQVEEFNEDGTLLADRERRLHPGQCPDHFGDAAIIDARTDARVIDFDLVVRNLVPHKNFAVCITIYKFERGHRVNLAQIARIVRRRHDHCGDHEEHITAVIKEPICSDERIFFHVIGNYVDCCDI